MPKSKTNEGADAQIATDEIGLQVDSGGGEGSTSAGRFPILQANRDPESNWEVDVAKSLEEYLLKICSGEISGEDGAYSFNFAEGTLVWISCVERVRFL
jgi:hypothetical protein